jgi:hypothetical protein
MWKVLIGILFVGSCQAGVMVHDDSKFYRDQVAACYDVTNVANRYGASREIEGGVESVYDCRNGQYVIGVRSGGEVYWGKLMMNRDACIGNSSLECRRAILNGSVRIPGIDNPGDVGKIVFGGGEMNLSGMRN